MTVRQFRKLLKRIPDHFDIAIDAGEGSLSPICPTDSGVVEIEFNDTLEKRFVFVICPCSCGPDGELIQEQEAAKN